MADEQSAHHLTLGLTGVERDLSVIAQVLRAMATGGYEATPEGLEHVGGMVFAANLRLSALNVSIVRYIESAAKVAGATRGLIRTVAEADAEIQQSIGLARQSLELIRGGDAEGFTLVEDCLRIIESRLLKSGHQQPPPKSNVVPLFQAKEGGRL